MKVSELLEILQEADPNDIVVLSSDAEGNRYSPASGWGLRTYVVDDLEQSWQGEVYERDDDTTDLGYCTPAFVLWPVN